MYDANVLTNINPTDRKALLSGLQQNKLSHAYLFVGEDTSCVESSHREFLSMLLSEDERMIPLMLERVTKHTHSDITDIYPDGASIKIGQLRSVIDFLQTAPTEGKYNVVVIHEAEKMNVQAQNFLLKTIEEPPEGAMIILLASTQEPILGTILSRVTAIYVLNRDRGLDNPSVRNFVSERMSKLILEGSIEGIFSTAKALMSSAEEQSKEISQKDIANLNLRYVYAFFVQMLIFNQTNRTQEYTKEDFGILAGKIGRVCNINIINIIEDTISIIAKNASVQLALESMLIRILEECNAENSWN